MGCCGRNRCRHGEKALRGEFFLTVAVGYVKAGGDRIEKDADRRVQEAVSLVYARPATAKPSCGLPRQHNL